MISIISLSNDRYWDCLIDSFIAWGSCNCWFHNCYLFFNNNSLILNHNLRHFYDNSHIAISHIRDKESLIRCLFFYNLDCLGLNYSFSVVFLIFRSMDLNHHSFYLFSLISCLDQDWNYCFYLFGLSGDNDFINSLNYRLCNINFSCCYHWCLVLNLDLGLRYFYGLSVYQDLLLLGFFRGYDS